MSLRLADRLLTIAVTAALTSAAWIAIGSADLAQWLAPEGAAPPNDTPASGVPGGAMPPTATGGEAEPLMIPVAGVQAGQLVDTFSQARDEGERPHEAIDIMAPVGTIVIAAGPGRVERLFLSEEGGNTIYIRSHDGRTLHYYGHLQSYAPGLREGQQVRRGQQIATVGATGNADASAAHLHFAVGRVEPGAEWWEPAPALNPYPLLRGD